MTWAIVAGENPKHPPSDALPVVTAADMVAGHVTLDVHVIRLPAYARTSTPPKASGPT